MNTASGGDIGGQAHWSLRLFGGFDLRHIATDERVTSLGKRERVLLAYLALSPNCRQPRRKLATLLWGDATDATALDNLRTCVWSLRKGLGDTEHRFIASEGEEVALDPTACEVDALKFRRLATQSPQSDLQAAANLYSGELLDGLDIQNEEFESWRRDEATRYRNQAVDVLTRLMTKLSESGETERAIETGLRISRLEPLHEAAIRGLMQLYAGSGRRGAAVQLYRTLADALRTELDAQPEAETRLLFAELARGGEEPAGVAATSDAGLPSLPTSMARASDLPGTSRGASAVDSNLTVFKDDGHGSSTSGEAPRPVFGVRASVAILAGVAVVAIMLIFYRQFVLSGAPEATLAGPAPSAAQASAISIAVLPFTNMSGDASQEFFSDGMSEEITSALAKIPDLHVVGRTSAFQFKGENKDLRAIGRSLNATHLLEGSVRKVGDRVRITAQLIQADSGLNIWTENYDREFTDVFAIQEEIAQAIATALRFPLGLQKGQHLVSNRTSNADSYENYLRARALLRGRGALEPGGPLTEAVKLLEQVVASDPNYAPAWGLLGQAYALIPAFSVASVNGSTEELRRVATESLQKAEVSSQRATRLDRNNIDGYTALGLARRFRGGFVEAEDLSKQALSLDPGNPDALHEYSLVLADVGRLKDSLAMRVRLQAQEPLVPIFNQVTATVLWESGRNDEAVELLKTSPRTFVPRLYLPQVYASMGRYGAAADSMLEIPSGDYLPGAVDEAIRLLHAAPANAGSPKTMVSAGALGFVYLYAGAPDRALDFFEGLAEAGYPALGNAPSFLWAPSYAALRKTERFKAYVRKSGMLDYWRQRGWPDLCRPMGVDDFICD